MLPEITEERLLLARSSDRSMSDFIRECEPFIRAAVASRNRFEREYEDAYAAGVLGFYRAALNFDHALSNSVKAHLYKRVQWSVVNYYRRQKKSLGTIFFDEIEGLEPIDDAKNPAEKLDSADFQKFLRDLIAELPPQSQKIIEKRVFSGETLQEIGKNLGFSKQYIDIIYKRSLEALKYKLKQHFAYSDFRDILG